MKNTLKELEEARKKYNVSKIPRRSLSFTADTMMSSTSTSNASKSEISKISVASGSR
jgi:hypothetical protein